jgi:SAM-dependent methyltransferase
MNSEMHDFFSGKRLYGDDFSSEEIIDWFKDEKEGYADLGAKDKLKYAYGYHELNVHHGFRFLRDRKFQEVLGFGGAYGDELHPIIHNINKITVLDPSDAFSDVKEVMETPCNYIKPNVSGHMPFANNQFDLITCLGVMHHIPNVSYVMSECYRCLDTNGIMLFREPIISMGDWRKPRRGLTKRERGIPIDILDNIVTSVGFSIKNRSMCNHPLIPKIANKLGLVAYNNYSLTIADAFISQLFPYKMKYHRTKMYEKFSPAAVYYVLEKKPK